MYLAFDLGEDLINRRGSIRKS